MAGMKITLSSAMRARDVSRPQPHHDTAAQAADTELSSTGPASRATAGGDQRGPAAGPTARTGPATPNPAPGSSPAPAVGPVAASGVRPESAEAGAARSGGSRRHRSRRRGR
jgi:hypothetical protein